RRLRETLGETVQHLRLGLEVPGGLRVLLRPEDRRHRGDESAFARELKRLLLTRLDELRLVRVERVARRAVAAGLRALPTRARKVAALQEERARVGLVGAREPLLRVVRVRSHGRSCEDDCDGDRDREAT